MRDIAIYTNGRVIILQKYYRYTETRRSSTNVMPTTLSTVARSDGGDRTIPPNAESAVTASCTRAGGQTVDAGHGKLDFLQAGCWQGSISGSGRRADRRADLTSDVRCLNHKQSQESVDRWLGHRHKTRYVQYRLMNVPAMYIRSSALFIVIHRRTQRGVSPTCMSVRCLSVCPPSTHYHGRPHARL